MNFLCAFYTTDILLTPHLPFPVILRSKISIMGQVTFDGYEGRVFKRAFDKAMNRCEFSISYCYLGEGIPLKLFTMKHLTRLELKRTSISILPPEIQNLRHLQYLELPGNALAGVPPEISQLVHLEVLDLSGNRIITLPDSFGNLVRLRNIDVSKNLLTSLPVSLIYVIMHQLRIDRHRLLEINILDNPVVGENDRTNVESNSEIIFGINKYNTRWHLNVISGYLSNRYRRQYLIKYFCIALGCDSNVLNAIYFTNTIPAHSCNLQYPHNSDYCSKKYLKIHTHDCKKCVVCRVVHESYVSYYGEICRFLGVIIIMVYIVWYLLYVGMLTGGYNA